MKTFKISKQKAFTLIEYMVAITIGLILLAGITYLFLGMKRSTETQSAISNLQESGRFALYFLTNDIQNAGWAEVEDKGYGVYTSPAFLFAAGQTADGGTVEVSDSITVRYEADTDCVGGATGGIAENNYFVQDGQLKCTGNSGSTQPLISNVDLAHFMYGIDTDGDSAPNKFVRASAVAPGERESVSAVKIILLLSSDGPVRQTNAAQSYTIGTEGTYNVTDRKARRIFTTTVTIPNKPAFVITT
ncbi:PilW family protein [Kangiella sediminilitoris]|uniref:Tfp pilus assembly protein PilW-like protein n=1 Tax=Kangiella sediminilitoris TaxID=1144748 RepID=A0A1B3BBC5_9GAMM|nr:PilW family protein [Kangiella sediminilitoris]AOE50095.1 Tfp pilus assembly protein PilW-like protein [Kangiella sediminilitoris]